MSQLHIAQEATIGAPQSPDAITFWNGLQTVTLFYPSDCEPRYFVCDGFREGEFFGSFASAMQQIAELLI